MIKTYLLILVLPLMLVVSSNPAEDNKNVKFGKNELPAIDNIKVLQRKHQVILAKGLITRLRRRATDGFPVTLHQQSTNSAAAKRDLHYNKQHARNARDFKMIVGEASNIHEKRVKGRFLPGQINSLSSSEVNEDEVYQNRGSSFQPPRIVYLDSALPQPFVRPEHSEHARVFGLTNFLTKDKPLMNPRSFAFEDNSKEQENEDDTTVEKLSTDFNVPHVSMQLTSMIRNDLKEEINQSYSLYQRIIDEEGDNPANSFEANSVAEEFPNETLTQSASQKSENFDEDIQDWDTKESNERFNSQQHNANSDYDEDSKYEFGYRVIDHSAGSDYGHQESHGNDAGVTNGRYHVLLPDGRVQQVEYFADHRGYHAEVSYISQDDKNRS